MDWTLTTSTWVTNPLTNWWFTRWYGPDPWKPQDLIQIVFLHSRLQSLLYEAMKLLYRQGWHFEIVCDTCICLVFFTSHRFEISCMPKNCQPYHICGIWSATSHSLFSLTWTKWRKVTWFVLRKCFSELLSQHDTAKHIWRFPDMGVPPNHPF